MTEKIVLLNPPAPRGAKSIIRDFYCSFYPKSDYYWPPQDLLAFSALLRRDYQLAVIDAVASGLDDEACLKTVLDARPATVIFSTGSVSLASDMQFVRRVKEDAPVRLIASAGIFRSYPERLPQLYPFVDGFITDFSGTSVCGLVPGGTSAGCGNDEFSIGRPLYEPFIVRRARLPFFDRGPYAIAISSFGCRFSCGFCAAGTYRIRYRKQSEVFDDLDALRSKGVKNVFFTDPLFTADQRRTLDFCRSVKGLGMSWVCNAHAATIQDEHTVRSMKEAGCRALLIGVESGDDAILRQYHKGADTALIKRAFAVCHAAKVSTLAYFIIGLPGQDRASVQRTIRFSRSLQCDYASFGHAFADPATPLYQDAVENGWLTADHVLETGALSRQDVRLLLRQAYRSFYLRPAYLARSLLRVRSLEGVGSLCRSGWAAFRKNMLS